MRVARLRKGDTLYRAGDLGTSAFVVLDGTLAHVFTDPASGTEVEVRCCFTTPSVCVRVCVFVFV
jgi:CRP-like cAMP-binding protein